MKSLHRLQESQSLSTWTVTRRRFKMKWEISISPQSTINSLATRLTIPTATYTISSILVAMQKQSSSTKEKIMKKSKLTARHLIIDYLTTTSTTRENDVATEQYLLLNRQNSRRSIPLIKNSIQDVFCTPKGSTRVSNASSFAKHSEHLHLLPTRTTRKRINMRKASFDNQRRRS